MDWELVRVRDELPAGLEELRTEALAQGFRALERLGAEWEDGRQRFERPGETLFATVAGGRLIGIGGITVDPGDPAAMRMRRFYVAMAWRRRGIARAIAKALLLGLTAGRIVNVNAGTWEAAAFWQGLGFSPAGAPAGCTHVLVCPGAALRG